MIKFTKYTLDHYPDKDFPGNLSCFSLQTSAQLDPHSLAQGQAIVRIHWVSLDPLLRTWISGARSYLEPVRPGCGIPGFGVGIVVVVRGKKGMEVRVQEGDLVFGMLEWSEYMVVSCSDVQRLPIDMQEHNYKYLSTYGSTGLTSYLSIREQIDPFRIYNRKLGREKRREELNIVISSVGGGVGLTLTEYLHLKGYRNIYGIAGTEEKCRAAEDRGCRATINYKKFMVNGSINSGQFQAGLLQMMGGQECDLYYQNVGQEMLTSMLKLMAQHSKIVMCGSLATYNNWQGKAGILNLEQMIFKRIEMKGILYFNRLKSTKTAQVFMEMVGLNPRGADVLIEGIQRLPTSYRDMIAGKFIGKPVIQIAPYPRQQDSQ